MGGLAPPEPGKLKVVTEILKSSAYKGDDIQEALRRLSTALGERRGSVVPELIDSVPKLEEFVFNAKIISEMAKLPGFDRIVLPRDAPSAVSFASGLRLASFLLDRGKVVEIEPKSTRGRSTDILWECGGQQIHVELKTLTTDIAEFRGHHLDIAAMLFSAVDPRVQLSVRFLDVQPPRFWERLAERIEEMMQHVSGEGVLISNSEIEVVAVPKEPNAGPHVVYLQGFERDLDSGLALPMTVVAETRGTIAVAGPRVPIGPRVKRALERARTQAPDNQAFVVAIDTQDLLGSRKEIKTLLNKEFQPTQNSRISGVLLFDIWPKSQKIGEVDFVQNPYARFPLNRETVSSLRA